MIGQTVARSSAGTCLIGDERGVILTTEAWTPEIRAQRIAGPSAYAISSVGVFSALGSIACVVILLVGMAVRGSGYVGSMFLTTVIVLGAASGVAAGVGNVYLHYWVEIGELSAGYTTVFRAPVRVSHIDPRSDRVVRRPGEPYLDPDEHRRRLALVRESARREKEAHRLSGLSARAEEPSDGWAAVIRDADGRPLAEGDTVTILRNLKGKKSAAAVAAGTRVRGIRLLHRSKDDRVVGVVVPGAGPARLKPNLVRKA